MKEKLFILIMITLVIGAVVIGCCNGKANSQGYYPPSPPPQQMAPQQLTYNNNYPGGIQRVPGVDAIEIRPNLRSSGAQVWFDVDPRVERGIWTPGGKFSLLFPSMDELMAWINNGMRPSAQELRAQAEARDLCKASIGWQKWHPWHPY